MRGWKLSLALGIFVLLLSGCENAASYVDGSANLPRDYCPAPMLVPWGEGEYLQLAGEMTAARLGVRSFLALREYMTLRAQIESCDR